MNFVSSYAARLERKLGSQDSCNHQRLGKCSPRLKRRTPSNSFSTIARVWNWCLAAGVNVTDYQCFEKKEEVAIMKR